MKSYDAIVIGAGHNGLVCAALLAKAGRSVLVLEASNRLGGLAGEREFHPGFHVAPAHSVSHFSSAVADELSLSDCGLTFEKPAPTTCLGENGDHVEVLGETVKGVSADDQKAYLAYRQQLLRFAGALDHVWGKTLPRIGHGLKDNALVYGRAGLALRLLGKEDMREFARVLTLPMRDLVSEHFDDPKLQALLSWDGVLGARMAPRSPNNAVMPLLLRMSGESGGDFVTPKGGVQSVTAALQNAAEKAGVEIKTACPVRRIVVHGDENGLKATGVELGDGDIISAKTIISSADPKTTFFTLIGAEYLDIEFSNRINRLRTNGYVAKFHAALSGLPAFNGLSKPEGRMIIAPELDAIEFAFDDAKYGEPAEKPVMEIAFPSLANPGLAPNGQHVMSAHVMYAPYKEKSNWSDATRAAFSRRIIDTIEKYAPGFANLIIHSELLTPTDLEREYGVTGGHWHHAELAFDQMLMMRPTYGAAQYKAPIPGVYLCGAGCHPGGGVMGLSGRNAAREILK